MKPRVQSDYIQMWLGSVTVSHSGAIGTQKRYRKETEDFLKYIGETQTRKKR